jgi:hypothetical protein
MAKICELHSPHEFRFQGPMLYVKACNTKCMDGGERILGGECSVSVSRVQGRAGRPGKPQFGFATETPRRRGGGNRAHCLTPLGIPPISTGFNPFQPFSTYFNPLFKKIMKTEVRKQESEVRGARANRTGTCANGSKI